LVPKDRHQATATLHFSVGFQDFWVPWRDSKQTGCPISDLVITKEFVEQMEPEALRAELLRHIDEGVRAIHISLTLPLREPVRCIAHTDTPDLTAMELGYGGDAAGLTVGVTRHDPEAGMPTRLNGQHRPKPARVLARWLGFGKQPVSDSPS
jgi:hypothetical protein